jgi:hypothetical protein
MRQHTAFAVLATFAATLGVAQVLVQSQVARLDPGHTTLSLPFRVAMLVDMAIMRWAPPILLGWDLLASVVGLGVGAWWSMREHGSRRPSLVLWAAGCALGAVLAPALWWTFGLIGHTVACMLLSALGFTFTIANMYAIVQARSGHALASTASIAAGALQLTVSPLAGLVVPMAVWFRSGSRA